MSKGCTARPIPNPEQFATNWDAIYAKPKVETCDEQRPKDQLAPPKK